MSKPLIIVGGGPVGRFAYDIAEAAGIPVRGFLDMQRPSGETLEGLPVLGHPEDIALVSSLSDSAVFYIGLGKPGDRRRLSESYTSVGVKQQMLIHPSVVRSRNAIVRDGAMVNAFSYLHSGSHVGTGSMVESHVALGTDAHLGDFVSVTQGVMIAARARIADDAYLGTGAVILPDITVGPRTIVGAGAVVSRDIEGDVTVVGVPARRMPS